MSRCRGCDCADCTQCQCSAASSDCIEVTGNGHASNPFQFNPRLDVASDNLITCGTSGLLGRLPSYISNPPRVKVRDNTTTTIPSGTVQNIQWSQADYDSAGMWSASTPFRVYSVLDGLYDCKYSGWFNAGSPNAGSRRIEVIRYPTGDIISTVAAIANTTSDSHSNRFAGAVDIEMQAGEYLVMYVYCGGSAVDIPFIATSATPELSLRYVAPIVP